MRPYAPLLTPVFISASLSCSEDVVTTRIPSGSPSLGGHSAKRTKSFYKYYSLVMRVMNSFTSTTGVGLGAGCSLRTVYRITYMRAGIGGTYLRHTFTESTIFLVFFPNFMMTH